MRPQTSPLCSSLVTRRRSRRRGLDEQHDVAICARERQGFGNRHDLGDQQADRGTHHLRVGRRGSLARAGESVTAANEK